MVLLLITFTPTGGVEIVAKTFGHKTGLASNAVSGTVTASEGTATVVRAPRAAGGSGGEQLASR